MKSKTDLNTVGNYRQAGAAGMLIGFGVIINATIENPVVAALFFGFGLLAIIALSIPLYTGRIGFYQDRTLVGVLIGNLMGVAVTIFLYLCANPDFHYTLLKIAEAKFEKTYLQMFCAALLCGMLIHFAVKIKQTVVTVLAIAIFILIGAEHCIADFPFLLAELNLENFIKWCLVILGNSWGAMYIDLMLAERKEEPDEICSDNSK